VKAIEQVKEIKKNITEADREQLMREHSEKVKQEMRERQKKDLVKQIGRPSLFRLYMIKEAYKLGAIGMNLNEIADFWTVRRVTLEKWARKHPEFKRAIKKGRTDADSSVVQGLYKKAKNGEVVPAIFWLKNRQPEKWRDRVPSAVAVASNVNIISNVPRPKAGDASRAGNAGQSGYVRKTANMEEFKEVHRVLALKRKRNPDGTFVKGAITDETKE
jgi:hypothetical protein